MEPKFCPYCKCSIRETDLMGYRDSNDGEYATLTEYTCNSVDCGRTFWA